MEKDNKTPARNATQGALGGENKIVQTYAEDMVQVIENDKEGLIKKIIYGEEEGEEERQNLSPESKKNKLFMFLGLLLLLVALSTLAFLFFSKEASVVPVEKQFTPLIFNDKSVFIEVAGLKKEEITQKILNEIEGASVKSGGVEGIYLTENKQIIGLRKFITLIKSSFIPGDNLLFVNDNFLLGVVNNEGKSAEVSSKDFFVLLKMRSTADIFEAMRTWENKMFPELYPFLGIQLSSETKYLLTKNFEDGIVENKNARILYDNNNKIVLMYVFADDSSVIITNTNESAKEIMLRLAASQVKK